MRTSRIYSSFLLAASVIAFFASSAQAEDWFFLARSDDGFIFFLDRNSISRKGNFSEVKTFYVPPKPEEDGTVAAIVTWECSCQDKKYRAKQAVSLLDDQSTKVLKETGEWTKVQAKTVNTLILQKACNSL